jgi:hypothetical protein
MSKSITALEAEALDWESLRLEDSRQSYRKITPVHPNQMDLFGELQEKRRRKHDDNRAQCTVCGDDVTLLGRDGIKLAWAEEKMKIAGRTRTVYWCKPCADATWEHEALIS